MPSGKTRLSPSVGTVSPTQLAASDHRAVVPPLSHVCVSGAGAVTHAVSGSVVVVPSLTVYVNVSVPTQPALGVYVPCPRAAAVRSTVPCSGCCTTSTERSAAPKLP